MSPFFQTKLLASYFLNAVHSWKDSPKKLLGMADVVAAYSDGFGLRYKKPVHTTPSVKNPSAAKPTKISTRAKTKLSKGDIAQLESYLERIIAKHEKTKPPESYAFLESFLSHLEFDKTDRDIAALLFFAHANPFEAFFDEINALDQKSPTSLETIAAFLGLPKKDVLARLKMGAPLMNSGLVFLESRDYEGNMLSDRLAYFLHHKIIETIDNEEYDVPSAIDRLIGKAVLPETEWEDFEHIKDEASYAAHILKGALEAARKGVNILVYGTTGTGKTAFCKTLAAHLDSPLYAVGEKDDEDEEFFDSEDSPISRSTASARMADKKLVENMLSRRKAKALTLFDEMEDIIGGGFAFAALFGMPASFPMGKAATNNLLTENEVPCLWTTNNIEHFDPALLRRFSYVIELKTPSANVRQRVILRTLSRYQRTLTEPQIAKPFHPHFIARRWNPLLWQARRIPRLFLKTCATA